ncbi:hypothetical protein [Jiangella sp. DSM 45060]|uniref:hypothetical protein n=1 Tax=Jiangella sp. DSM 45060 TaxID=1798224 RepID=UPI00087B7A37|nr:hypothetical protein [Jiangella sp. DSM 45060]SDT07955.1 hypothetical protein SAMN04515669_2718 [Jiangella sp. DSM 45060]
MLRKITTSLLAAAALGAAALAGGGPAVATTRAEPSPSPGPVTAMAWRHSGFQANEFACSISLALTRAAGTYTMPGTGPCYHSAQGYYFYYWK